MATLISETTMTQKAMILDIMRESGSISQIEAFEEIGCFRLASRISDLRKDGYDIKRKMETKRNRYGKPVTFARYWLIEDKSDG